MRIRYDGIATASLTLNSRYERISIQSEIWRIWQFRNVSGISIAQHLILQQLPRTHQGSPSFGIIPGK
jgi:hypothetical protein